MIEKKYQIFVSSTYTDLIEERLAVLDDILKSGYIPMGMEYFPAVDEEQLQFIYRVIDQSDYYVLILGARYGTLDREGISYTEREYNYAVKQGKKVIALILKDPQKIENEKKDQDKDRMEKFLTFRQKVMDAKRIVAFWKNTTELVSNFHSSIEVAIKKFPAIGWVRGNEVNLDLANTYLGTTEFLKTLIEMDNKNEKIISFINACIEVYSKIHMLDDEKINKYKAFLNICEMISNKIVILRQELLQNFNDDSSNFFLSTKILNLNLELKKIEAEVHYQEA